MNGFSKLTMAITSAAMLIMGVAASAEAAVLNFSFTTQSGTSSFNLDTSVIDSSSSPNEGIYRGAVSDLTIFGNDVSASELVTVFRNVSNPNQISFVIEGNPSNYPFYGVFIQFSNNANSLFNQLSSEPEFYETNFLSGRVDYGSLRFLNQEPFDNLSVTRLDTQDVPEPTTMLGTLALGALGAAWRLRKQGAK